ncbi:MAG: hypothetical protein ACTSU5_13970 [Promethearchaeota archaeon]
MSKYVPYTPRTSKTLKKDDERVRVLGSVGVVRSRDGDRVEFSLEDDFGSIEVISPPTRVEIAPGRLVRVFGSLSFEMDGSMRLVADFVQDMAGLDLELYKKVSALVQ